jgi:gamma-glutamylcyclotransferase
MRIFSYGSNMSSLRIRKRCPSAVAIDTGYITGYRFLFNKVSKDGSGKGNTIRTNFENDEVWGVIFEICEHEKRSLDKAEGKGKGYVEQTVTVTNGAGLQSKAQIYLAIDPAYLNNELFPFDWYKEHCIRGAKEFNLAVKYVTFLQTFESLVDTDAERRNRELAL